MRNALLVALCLGTIAAIGSPFGFANTITAEAGPRTGDSLGLALRVLPDAQRRVLGVKFGLVVQTIDADVKAPRLDVGDVIVAVDSTEFVRRRISCPCR